MLYRISRNRDLARGKSNSILRVEQIHIPRRQPVVKKKKDETKILRKPEAIRRIMCVGGTRNDKNTRENNLRQKGY